MDFYFPKLLTKITVEDRVVQDMHDGDTKFLKDGDSVLEGIGAHSIHHHHPRTFISAPKTHRHTQRPSPTSLDEEDEWFSDEPVVESEQQLQNDDANKEKGTKTLVIA